MAYAWRFSIAALAATAILLCDSATGTAWQIPFLGKKKEATQPVETASPWTEKVADVNGEPITRGELAEELIGTYGAKQVELLINRKLIEQACKSQKIDIKRDELESELQATLKRLNLKREEFVNRVLSNREMTLSQYMRDTIWPKVALQKLVSDKITITADELQKSFEANYGAKVDVRMLVVKELKKAQDLWKKVDEEKDGEKRLKLFEDICKTYSIDEATRPFSGRCQPIGRFSTFGEIETVALGLKPNELSKIVQIQEGYLMLLCVAHIPPVANVTYDSLVNEKSKQTVRDYLTADLKEKKQRLEVANCFKAITTAAKVQNYYSNEFEAKTLDKPRPATASKPVPQNNRAN